MLSLAQGARTLSVPTLAREPGATFFVPVNISDATGVAGFEFTLSFNPAHLQVVRPGDPARPTALTSGFTVGGSADNTAGRVRVTLVGSAAIASGSGAFAEVEFRVRPDAPIGAGAALTLSNVVLRDARGNPLSPAPTLSNGFFTVATPARRLSIPNASVPAGDKVKITINTNDASGIAGGDFAFTFNPAILQATRPQSPADLTPLTAGFNVTGRADNATGTVQIALASNTALAAGSGALVEVEFQVNRNATFNMQSPLNFTQAILRDAQGNRIAAATQNGVFTVAAGRRITIPALSGLAGAEVDVPINIDNAAGVAGGDFTIAYNPAIAQVVRPGNPARTTPLTMGFSVSGSADNRAGRVQVSLSGAAPITSGSGALLTVTFRLSPTASPGQFSDLNLLVAVVRDRGGEPFASTPTNGRLTVATPTRQLSLPTLSAAAGGRVTVAININDASGVAGGNLAFTYDPAILQSLTPNDPARTTALTAGFNVTGRADNETGRLEIAFAHDSGILSGSGALLTVEFRVLLTAAPGAVTNLNFTQATLFDARGNRLPLVSQNGRFTVAAGRLVSVPDATSPSGSIVNIGVVIDEGNGLTGIDLVLRYNPAILQAVHPGNPAQTTALTVGFTVSGRADNTAGQMQLSLASDTPLGAGGGTLVIIPFQVKTGVGAGATSPLTLVGAVLRDQDGVLIPSSLRSGTFTVQAVTPRRVSIPTNLSGVPGALAQVPLNVDNHDGVAGGDFTFAFDPTVLQVVRPEAPVDPASLPPGFTATGRADNARGEVRLSLASAVPLGGGAGTLLRVDVLVRPDAALGRTSPLNFQAATLRDRDGNLLPTATTDGVLTTSGGRRVSVPTVDASATLPTAVPINIDDATGVAGADITLTFDPTVVQVLNPASPAEAGPLAPDATVIGNADNVRGVVHLALSRGQGIAGGGGTLLRLIMLVNPTAPTTATSPLNLTRVVLRDQGGAFIPSTTLSGLLRIAPDRVLSTPNMELAPGSQVFVPVLVNNAAHVAGLDVDFRFDNDLLEIDAVNPVQLSPLTSGFTFQVNADNATGRAQVTLASADAIPAGSGALLFFNLRLKDTAPIGQITPLTLAAARLHARFGALIPSVVSSGTLRVIEFRIADCIGLDLGAGAVDLIRLRFTSTLNAAEAVDPARYEVRVPQDAATPLDLSGVAFDYDNATQTVTLSRLNLNVGDTFKVTVTNLHSSSGAPLPPDGVSNVCIGTVRDGIPPRLIACEATATSISVTFSEPMTLGDVTQSFVYDVRIPATAAVPLDLATAVVIHDTTTNTTIISNITVPSNTTFRVRVVAVRDAAGNFIVDDGVSNVCVGSTGVAAPENVVSTTADNGDNLNPLPGSLRAALVFANNHTGPDTIEFRVPVTDPGFNGQVFVFRPLAALPPLTDSDTTLDGSTQTAFTGDTNPNGPEIVLNGASAGTDGLTITSARNVVRALVINGFSGHGIAIVGGAATDNTIIGCYIGTDAGGGSAVGNGAHGVRLFNCARNTVGGTDPARRNLIAGNGASGVSLEGGGNHRVLNNYIGTTRGGSAALPNGGEGVFINASANNEVGAPSAGNVLSGNRGAGVRIVGAAATNNVVAGNRIGTTAGGDAALPNRRGVVIALSANSNTVGGTATGAGNVISGNTGAGVEIVGAGANGNHVVGNIIGANAAGGAPVPNNSDGILVSDGAADNTIGGAAATEGNLIAFNGRDGVRLEGAATVNNRITRNRTVANGGIGINLVGGIEDASGVTANDPGDGDSGPNNLMNTPVITRALGGSLTVEGSLDTPNPQTTVVEIFATSRASRAEPLRREGETFLGSATPDSSGNWSVTLTLTVPDTSFITATATDSAGNTSEFSAPVEVGFVSPPTAEPRLSGSAEPSTVEVGGTATLRIRTDDTAGNPIAGARVSLQVTSGGGTLSVTSVVTDNTGSAQATLSNVPLGVNTVTLTTTLGGRSFTVTVDVIGVQRFHLAAGVSFFSIPFDVSNIPPPTLFNIPAEQVKLAEWDTSLRGGAGDYVFYTPRQVDLTHRPFNLLRGRGYWIQTDSARTVDITTSAAPDPNQPAEVDLSRPTAGWVAAGNPTLFALRWDLNRIRVLRGGTDVGALSQAGGAVNPNVLLVDPYAWIFDPRINNYRLVFDPAFLGLVEFAPELVGQSIAVRDDWPSGHGAWIFVRVPNLRLRFPPALFVRQARAKQA
ncbi:MAG: cohesin domain-containing protein, partial [Abditibacteriales bacterium]|nr:cohesin domain-containing protein [Abditibacteriales bacterium]